MYYAKVATAELLVHPFDMNVIFYMVYFLTMIPTLYVHKKHPIKDFHKEFRCMITLRNFFNPPSILLDIYAAIYLPIFILITLFNTSPFWASIMAFFVNKEKIACREVICIFGCIGGLVILSLANIGSEGNQEKLDN